MKTGPTSPATREVWRIESDHPAPLRFNAALPLSGVTRYTIGVSDPSLDWPRTSAGPLDDSTSYEGSSFDISFVLPEELAAEGYVLRASGAEGSGPIPNFIVRGADWTAYCAIRRERRNRAHAPLPPGPTAGLFALELALPHGRLTPGWNTLSIVTEPVPASEDHGASARQDRRSPGSWFGNTWVWHSLSLEIAEPASKPVAEVDVLPLFRELHGRDHALVRITVRGVQEADPDQTQLRIGESEWNVGQAQSLSRGDFGDFVAVLAVPEFWGTVDAAVRIGDDEQLFSLSAARKWTVHVIPQVHLDLGYTDLQAKITEIHALNVDRARAITAIHPNYRFTLDGTFIAEAYERTRKPDVVRRFHQEIVDGHLGVNAFWSNPLTGVCSREELVRGLFGSAARRRDGTARMSSANLTDVPSYTGALPSVLAGAGIHRFFGIANHMRGGNADSDVLHLISPVIWKGPDDSRVVTFFADCYTQLRTVCSDQPSVFGAAAGLAHLLERYERDDYPHADLPLYGTHADNEDLGSGYADLVDRWASEYSWPRLRFSTIDDYFDAIETGGGDLPIVEGDGGAFWEDGVGTAPQLHSVHRWLQSRMPEVETVSALVTSQSTVLRADTEGLDTAWRGLLVGGEHTFTASYATDAPYAAGVGAQIRWKEAQLERSVADAEDLRLRAMAQLADQIEVEGLPSVLAVNPLSWSRDGVIDLELPAGHGLRRSSGDILPSVPLGAVLDGRVRTRVALPVLPAFGYEGFAVVPMTRGVTDDQPVVSDGELVIGSYIVRIDGGKVSQLTQRATGRPILDQTSQRLLGDVVVVNGGGTATGRGRDDERSSLWDYDPDLPRPVMSEITASRGPITMQTQPNGDFGTLCWTVEVAGVLTGRVQISLVGDEIDLLCEFVKEPSLAKQSVYVAFPFLVGEGTWLDRQQGGTRPERMLPGAGVDWFTHTNAVVLGAGNEAIAWASKDAALVVFDAAVNGQWRTRHERRTGLVLSWVTNNYWFTNTLASQQGKMKFRYRFAPGYSGASATRMGKELRSDLWVSEITVADRRDPWPRPRPPLGSLWDPLTPDEIEITVFASRFHESALLVRVQEIEGANARVLIPPPPGVGAAVLECNDVEDVIGRREISDQALDVDLLPFQVRNFLFSTEGTA